MQMSDWCASGGCTAHTLTICLWVVKCQWTMLILLLHFWEAGGYFNVPGPWYKYRWLGKYMPVASLAEEVTIENHEQSDNCFVSSSLCKERKLSLRFLNIMLVDFLICHNHNALPTKSEFIRRKYFLPSLKFCLRTLQYLTLSLS